MFAQTFSKTWAMTGWRIGWLECPVALGPTVENLIQYSSSGVAAFLQRAGIAALQQGESFVEHQIARAREGREIVSKGLADTGRVTFGAIDGAFYLFFKVEGIEDTRKLAMQLVDEANVGRRALFADVLCPQARRHARGDPPTGRCPVTLKPESASWTGKN